MFAAFCFGDAPARCPLTLPGQGWAELLLDTDWQCFGGGSPRPQQPQTAAVDASGRLALELAPFSGQLWRWQPRL